MPPIPELEAIRKAQILEAAMGTIAESGCANVTMAGICRAAGLSKGGLAHYYKSKQELFKEVFTEFFNRIFERGRDTMARFDDPLEKILSFVWLYDWEDPDVSIGYPILFDFMSTAVHSADYRNIFNQWVNKWLALLKTAIELGQSRGQFKKIDAEDTARTISAIYQGIATRWFLAPDQHSTEWAIASLQRAVTSLLASYENQPSTDRKKEGAENGNI
jgi:AcrR family transcriptional regulator